MNKILEQLDTFKDRSNQIGEWFEMDKVLDTRENLPRSGFGSKNSIVTPKRLRRLTRVNILKFYAFSIHCYGCEAWKLNRVRWRKIDVFEIWCQRKMGEILMLRPNFQRRDPKDLEKKEIALRRHPTKEIKILWPHQRERQHTNNYTVRWNPRNTPTRSTMQHLVHIHQGVDSAEGRGMCQNGCRPQLPLGCHLASTFVKKTIPPVYLGNWFNTFNQNNIFSIFHLFYKTLECMF